MDTYRIYYLFVGISLLFFLNKYKSNKFFLFIILLFFNGFFAYIDKSVQNGYKIVLVILDIYFLLKTKAFENITDSNKWVWLSFILFSSVYFISSYLSEDYFFIIFSQYSRYFILFSFFLILDKYRFDDTIKNAIEGVLYELLLLQIILSIVKFFTIGMNESYVGSISSEGGALATTFPMFGFMIIWFKKKGVLTKKEWIITVGLLFIGFMSYKRAIWFIMPILIAFFMFYIPKRKVPFNVILISLIAVPLVFYLGVRLNPDLNKEKKIGGSFDIGYVIDYANFYTFGDKKKVELGAGRGGATLLLVDKFNNSKLTEKDWMGYGLTNMYATNYEEFNELDFGLNHKGAATGVFQTLVVNGFVGIFTTLAFTLSLMLQIDKKRIQYVFIAFFCWEYFFYTGLILRDNCLSFMLVFIIIYYGSKAKSISLKNEPESIA